MTDNVENLILEHLRAIRTDIGVIRDDITDMKLRVSSLEEHMAGMRCDLGSNRCRTFLRNQRSGFEGKFKVTRTRSARRIGGLRRKQRV